MNPYHTAVLLFGLALLLPCSAARAAEKEYRWGFDAGQVENGRLKPLAGSHDAGIEGTVQFATSPSGLGALALDGKSNSVIVTSDPRQLAGLPDRSLTLEGWVLMRSQKEWSGIVGAFRTTEITKEDLYSGAIRKTSTSESPPSRQVG